VKLLDQIGALVKAIMSTKQELTHHRESLKELERQANRIEDMLHDVRERLVRLETLHDAHRAEIEADLSRFKSEVERAETRISRLLPEPRKRK